MPNYGNRQKRDAGHEGERAGGARSGVRRARFTGEATGVRPRGAG